MVLECLFSGFGGYCIVVGLVDCGCFWVWWGLWFTWVFWFARDCCGINLCDLGFLRVGVRVG